jgi:dephospho-CoA kinase
MSYRHRKQSASGLLGGATSLSDGNTLGSRVPRWSAVASFVILVASLLTNSAIAGDTDRLANCVARADLAKTAAENRDAGLPSEKTTAIIAKQMPEESTRQIKRTVNFVYGDYKITPDEASEKLLQNCFEME